MILRILGLLLFVVMIWGAIKILLDRLTFNLPSLISLLLFGAIGFAVGTHYSEGWAVFGAIFGGVVGIELKDKLYEVVGAVYRDITDD